MARIVAVVALSCLAAVGVWSPLPTQGAKQKGSPPKQEPPPSVTFIHSQESTQEPVHWYNTPEGWLVVVGFLTLGFIAWQAVLTKRAVRAAEKGVNAQINSERAWVIAELKPTVTRYGEYWYRPSGSGSAPLSQADVLAGKHLRHFLKLTNMGRTPAHILSFRIGYSCLLEGVKELPEESAEVALRVFDHLLAGTEGMEIFEPIIDVYHYIKDSRTAIDDLTKTAVFHGWVKYQHVFSESEVVEAHFIYVFTPRDLSLSRVELPRLK